VGGTLLPRGPPVDGLAIDVGLGRVVIGVDAERTVFSSVDRRGLAERL